MSRFEDWPRRLDAAIEAARERPFSWGVHDCALFASGVVEAITGRDPAARWRGRYASEYGAKRLMTLHGGLAAMATLSLGSPIPALQAQRGDMVLREDEAIGPALGICLGARCAFVSPQGLVQRPLSECECAWRV